MFQKLKRYTFALITLVLYCHEATADEALMDGVRPFICDGEAIVFQETNDGWVISTDPTAEVKPTGNGWRYEDALNGGVWYLREESRNSWVIEGLSEDGYFKLDCLDVADSVSQVVTIIKPRLDENMMAQLMDIQSQLAETKSELLSTQAHLAETTGELMHTQDQLTHTQARLKRLPVRPLGLGSTETVPTPSTDAAVTTPAGPQLSGAEQYGFRIAVNNCWNVDAGSRAAQVTVTVGFSLDQNGRVSGDVRMIGASGGDARAQRTAYEAARRAVLRCQSSGYDLPVEKYEQWKDVEMTFAPSGLRLR